MKEKPNPLAGLVDAMKAHDNRLARSEPKSTPAPVQVVVTATKTPTRPVQTVATVEKPRRVGEKIFCAGVGIERGFATERRKIHAPRPASDYHSPAGITAAASRSIPAMSGNIVG